MTAFDPARVNAALRALSAIERDMGPLKPACLNCGSPDVFPGLPRCRICESVWQSDMRDFRGHGK